MGSRHASLMMRYTPPSSTQGRALLPWQVQSSPVSQSTSDSEPECCGRMHACLSCSFGDGLRGNALLCLQVLERT